MNDHVVQTSFAGSDFTLSATCPSGATSRTLYLSEEAAEKIAGILSESLEETGWAAKKVAG